MNILLINHYAGSPKYGMAYRPYYLAREWVKAGHKVQILAASFSHIRTKQPEFSGLLYTESIDGIDYCWFKTPCYGGNGVARVKNIWSFLLKIKTNSKKIANTFKPDVVIASSTYPMDIWSAHRIAKYAQAQLVFEVHDLWPLSPIELGGMSSWHPFILWCRFAESYAYKNSDVVISMLPKAKKYMESRGMISSKFHYIPNGVDIHEWKNIEALPSDIKKHLEKIKKKGLPIVGYAGTHGLANALDFLLDAAKMEENLYEVILVGTGPERERLKQRVLDEKINNISMLPAIPKRSIPAFLAEIDIAYIGWHDNPLYRFGISPNKLMDYMMAKKPIIHSVKAGNDPVLEAGCGITIEPENPIIINDSIKLLINMETEKLKILGENGHNFILSNQTYSVLASHFLTYLSVHLRDARL